jgi:hypothetical protein
MDPSGRATACAWDLRTNDNVQSGSVCTSNMVPTSIEDVVVIPDIGPDIDGNESNSGPASYRIYHTCYGNGRHDESLLILSLEPQ